MTTLIQKNGMLFTISNNGENEEDFSLKLEFIFKDFKNERGEFETKSNLAKCYVQHKKLGCIYNKEIMDIIQKN